MAAPVIFYLDDNLFTVPPELGPVKVRKHADPVRQATLRHLLDEAELVYLLFEQLQIGDQLTRNAFVADIASDSDPVLVAPAEPPALPIVFGYMASSAHGADLAMIIPAIVAALTRYPDRRFERFGTSPSLHARAARRPGGQPAANADYDVSFADLPNFGWHFASKRRGVGKRDHDHDP